MHVGRYQFAEPIADRLTDLGGAAAGWAEAVRTGVPA